MKWVKLQIQLSQLVNSSSDKELSRRTESALALLVACFEVSLVVCLEVSFVVCFEVDWIFWFGMDWLGWLEVDWLEEGWLFWFEVPWLDWFEVDWLKPPGSGLLMEVLLLSFLDFFSFNLSFILTFRFVFLVFFCLRVFPALSLKSAS